MKLTAVMVIYNQVIEESKTYQTLSQYLFSQSEVSTDMEVIIYDNSPEKQILKSNKMEGITVQYVHDASNPGIAKAYNFALSKAIQNGSDWLLLLDHDTQLTREYIHEITHLPELDGKVAAVVPKITTNHTMISPVYSRYLRPLKGEQPRTGLQEEPVMAINSASIIRVDFLNDIGGFNEAFRLDYLDHWVYYEVYARNRMVWLLDVTLEHDLSVMNYAQVSLNRYRSILDSEVQFYKDYKRDLYPSYKKQLRLRFLKQVLTVKNKKIALYTFRQLFKG